MKQRDKDLRFYLLPALILVLAAAGIVEGANGLTRDGRLSTVRLIEITSADTKRPWPELSGAPDGLRFIFLILRKPHVAGFFSVKELRDFTVEGNSYRASTRRVTGKEYEPGTSIWNVRQFLETRRPDLASRIPVLSDHEAVVMETTVGGLLLAGSGRCEVTIEAGWDSDIERFSFPFDMATIVRSVPK